jgi:hypothetical protein
VKPPSWSITIGGAIVVVGLGWFGAKQYRCQRRNAAFVRRIVSIKQDAHEQLKIGTKKANVARFYTEHKIPFEVVSWPFKDGGSEAIGTLYTIGGCAPLGCGNDNALIGVRVKVDADGAAVGEPEVVSIYTDCL